MDRLRIALFAALGVVVLVAAGFGIALATVDFARFRGLVAAQVEQATGRALTFRGEASLKLFPRPSLRLRDVGLANAAWGSEGDMLRVGELAAQVELWPLVFQRSLRITRLVARDVVLQLEVDAQGRRSWDLARADAPEGGGETAGDVPGKGGEAVRTDASGLPQIGALQLENVTVNWRDARRPGSARGITVTELRIDTQAGGRVAVAASLLLDGQAMSVKGELDRPAGFLAPGGPFAATLDITLPSTVARLTGGFADARAGTGLDATLLVEAEPLQALDALAGRALPAVKATLAARLQGDLGETVRVSDLKLVVGRSDLAGKGEVNMAGARPRVVADLEAERLDMLQALPPAPGKPGEAPPAVVAGVPAAADGRLFSAEKFELPDLRAVDADVSLRAAVVDAPGMVLSQVSFRVVLVDGDLALRPFAFTVAGNSLAGDARLNARGEVPALALDMAAQKLDVGALLGLFGAPGVVEARGDLVVALRGRGASPRAVAGTLEGNASLVVGQGTLAQNYVEGLGLGPLKAVVPQLQKALDAKLNCGIARFDVKGGVATARLLALDAGDLSIVGNGSLNLGSETLALDFGPRLRIPGVPGFGGLVVPVQVRGSLLEPVVTAGGRGGVARGNPLAALGAIVLDPGASRANPCGGLAPR